MLTPILLSALAMTLIVGVRYLIVSGAFALATRLRHPGLYASRRAQIAREIGWSLASAAVYGLPAGIVAWGWDRHGWTRITSDPAAYPLWWFPLSILLYLAAHDAWFYWTHRAMHRPRLFRAAHAVHHASRPPTAWAAMSFHPWEALTGAIVIPALVFLIPIHVGALAIVLGLMTLMGVTNHMGWEIFPRALVHGPAGRWLITATHHQRHHRDYGCNYGLYFRFWDRLCRTDRGLGDFGAEARRGTDDRRHAAGGGALYGNPPLPAGREGIEGWVRATSDGRGDERDPPPAPPFKEGRKRFRRRRTFSRVAAIPRGAVTTRLRGG